MGEHHHSYESVWQKVLQNDMQALECIYKGYYPNLFAYAEKLTKDASMAEDAIHDTFLYLWQHRQQIGVIQSLRFYLFRSVRNTCLKLIQKQRKLSRLEEADVHLDLSILPDELHLTHPGDEIKSRVQKALQDLSPRQREIIFLKFYNNLDYEEIGEVLGINYQSVVNHVHRGIQKLRDFKALDFFKKM